MARAEAETYQVAFGRLSPGRTIDVLTCQAQNSKNRLVLMWTDPNSKRTLVFLTVNPFLAKFPQQGDLSLKDIYELMISADKILVRQSPYASIPNPNK